MKTTKITSKDVIEVISHLQSNMVPKSFVKSNRRCDTYKTFDSNGYTAAGMAQRFNDLIQMIGDTAASVKIVPDAIYIEYKNGSAKLQRDILTDKILIPALTQAETN